MIDNPEAAHMMEPITAPNVQPATETEGGQSLEFREENDVKVFEITTKAVQWPILDDVTVTAYTYNGTVPGPMIRVTEGDQVRVIVADDGRGFRFHGHYDHATLAEMKLGPVTLKERIVSLGGSLSIDSSESGARLEIVLPVARAEDRDGD